MAKPSQVIILVEDIRHQRLTFRYLRLVGLDTHAMRFVLPSSGSGEQWVREQFPVEVAAYRRRNARAKTKLIAVIDADKFTVQDRLAQLDQKLADAGVGLIHTNADQVARLVPRHNIETWILCLNDVPVDEITDYKRTRNDWADLIRPAAETLHAWTRPNAQLPANFTPSLKHGVVELSMLDFT